jgi:hypothetical protein
VGEARRRKPATVGQTIGGVLVGFDEQVWRNAPPAQERVEQTDRVQSVVAANGLTIEMPAAVDEAAADEAAAWAVAAAQARAQGEGATPGDVGPALGPGPDARTNSRRSDPETGARRSDPETGARRG